MSTLTPPPIYDIVTTDEGKLSVRWIDFMGRFFDGDAGVDWEPTFQNLTTVGTPTITGRYYRLSKYLTAFRVLIVPGTNTTSTAGTTYIDNYPVSFTNDGVCFAVSGNFGEVCGHIVASNNRIYPPIWTAVTVPLTIIGFGEAT